MKPSWPPRVAAGITALMGLYTAPHLMSCTSLYGIAPGLPLSDLDGDGVPDDLDCAPGDATIFPGAEDIPADGIDQDCDGADEVAETGDTGGTP